MDNKNVFIAIALSMSVLLFWGAFVETPKQIEKTELKQNLQKKVENSQNISPNIEEVLETQKISRKQSINKVNSYVFFFIYNKIKMVHLFCPAREKN